MQYELKRNHDYILEGLVDRMLGQRRKGRQIQNLFHKTSTTSSDPAVTGTAI